MTTRTLVLVAWIWACRSNADPLDLVEGGTLIAIDEGGPARTLSLSSEAHLVGAHPSWAHDDGHQLVLEPGCDAILGTTGPAQEFQLVLEIAATKVQVPVVVDVHPSGEGACHLRVAVCVEPIQQSGPGNADGHSPCDSVERGLARNCGSNNGIVDGRVVIGFGSATGSGASGTDPFSDPTTLDMALAMSLTDPGCITQGAECDPLDVQFSTDAPLKIRRETTGSATPAGREYCATIANENITGGFELTYSIMRGDPSSGVVVGGDRMLIEWNTTPHPEPYGAELLWCAADGTSDGACITHRSFTSGSQQWTVHKCKPNATLAIGMRLWASRPPNVPADYALHVSATLAGSPTSIGLVVPPRRGAGALDVPASASAFPLDLVMDLDTVDSGTIVLDVQGNGNGDFMKVFERRITVETGSGPPCQ